MLDKKGEFIMSNFGKWEVRVSVGSMPQKVATAFDEFNDTIVGAEYNEIAYLGSQIVNGTNHAVLAEQTVLTGKDTKNIVLMVFKETKEGVSLVNIERIVESGEELGGIKVNVQTEDIDKEAKTAFEKTFESFVGSKVSPIALLATQVTKGVNYIFVSEVTPITAGEADSKVALTVVNGMNEGVSFIDILSGRASVLNYAFNW